MNKISMQMKRREKNIKKSIERRIEEHDQLRIEGYRGFKFVPFLSNSVYYYRAYNGKTRIYIGKKLDVWARNKIDLWFEKSLKNN